MAGPGATGNGKDAGTPLSTLPFTLGLLLAWLHLGSVPTGLKPLEIQGPELIQCHLHHTGQIAPLEGRTSKILLPCFSNIILCPLVTATFFSCANYAHCLSQKFHSIIVSDSVSKSRISLFKSDLEVDEAPGCRLANKTLISFLCQIPQCFSIVLKIKSKLPTMSSATPGPIPSRTAADTLPESSSPQNLSNSPLCLERCSPVLPLTQPLGLSSNDGEATPIPPVPITSHTGFSCPISFSSYYI